MRQQREVHKGNELRLSGSIQDGTLAEAIKKYQHHSGNLAQTSR